MTQLSLYDVYSATGALERLVARSDLSATTLLRVTRYFKWANTHGSAIRAAREALGRAMGTPDAEHRGQWHIKSPANVMEYQRRLRAALADPATVPSDLRPVPAADLFATGLTVGEVASVWFMVADWDWWLRGSDADTYASSRACKALFEDLTGHQIASAATVFKKLSDVTATPALNDKTLLDLARWYHTLTPMLLRTRELLIEAGTIYGVYNNDTGAFDISPDRLTEYAEYIAAPMEQAEIYLPPPLVYADAIAAGVSGLAPRDLLAIDWMLEWGDETAADETAADETSVPASIATGQEQPEEAPDTDAAAETKHESPECTPPSASNHPYTALEAEC